METSPVEIESDKKNETKFKPNFVVVCDNAKLENGKLNIIGVFDTVYAEEFPATQTSMTIVTRKEISKEKDHLEKMIISIDDKKIFENERKIKSTDSMHQLISRFENLNLPKEGKYIVDVYIDSQKILETYFIAVSKKLDI